MHANPDPRLVATYNLAMICKTFPAYRIHELRETPAGEILLAMQLMETARKAQQ